MAAAQFLGDLETIHLWQHDIQDDHVIDARKSVIQAGLAIVHGVYLVIGFHQYLLERQRQLLVVFNNENLHVKPFLSFSLTSYFAFHCSVRTESFLKGFGGLAGV